MKKQQIKALKKLAEMLPESVTLAIEPEFKKAYELSQPQIDSLKGEFDIEAIYKTKKYKIEPINHLNRLQKAYSRYKEQGLADYITWLDNNNKRMNKLFDGLNTSSIDNDILEIAKKGGKGFWSSLMNFIFAFYNTFIKSKLKTA